MSFCSFRKGMHLDGWVVTGAGTMRSGPKTDVPPLHGDGFTMVRATTPPMRHGSRQADAVPTVRRLANAIRTVRRVAPIFVGDPPMSAGGFGN